MRVVSLNVGLPRVVQWRDKAVRTSIFKTPVERRLQVRFLNIEGDAQADLTVHGGADKAVYVYPSEHYEFWRTELPNLDLGWGAFGENVTSAGVLEDIAIGSEIQIGSAQFIVTQPRMPCYKLGIRFDRADMVKRFLHSRRSGFYMKVSREGEIGAGDTIELSPPRYPSLSVTAVVELYTAETPEPKLLQRALQLPDLPQAWRDDFSQRL